MARCDMCGKTPQAGHNVSHSHRKTKRTWAPNIKRTTITVNGTARRAALCTRCLRTLAKAAAA
ncbi:MAG TPA: 50S ribosomal protein L28 [Dehalococcoidia bacterium]|nr:50S ribosomal protein L28 [Dehalococcoidia bacterium]